MQRTEAWYRQRRGKLTASALGQALGLTPWGTPKRLASELRLDRSYTDLDARHKEPKKANIAMRWGTENEPNGLLEYQIATSQLIEEVGFCEHRTLDWFGGSPDGLVYGGEGLVEVKCPYSRRCYSEFPPYYYPQINALLEITGRQWCDLFVWTPDGHRIWRCVANKQAFETLLPHYTRFWACVHTGQVPPNPCAELLPQVRKWIATDVTERTSDTMREIMHMLTESTTAYNAYMAAETDSPCDEELCEEARVRLSYDIN